MEENTKMSNDSVSGRSSTVENDIEKSSDLSSTLRHENFTASILDGSDTAAENCDICEKYGKTIQAEGFCKECNEFLCKECTDYHKKLKATEHHVIQDKSSMPTERPKVKGTCKVKCSIHSDKVIEYFCKACEQTGCTACITTKHHNCTGIDHIPDIVDGLEESQELKDFAATLNDIAMKLEHNKATYHSNVQRNSILKSQVQAAVKKHREQLEAAIHLLEQSVEKQLQTWDKYNQKKLASVSQQQDKLCKDLETLTSNIKSKTTKGQMCELFIAMKAGQRELNSLQHAWEDIEIDNDIQNYEFQPLEKYPILQEQIQASGAIVALNSAAVEEVSEKQELAVKTSDDKMSCTISGLCLLPGDLLVVSDIRNETLKLLQLQEKTILASSAMTSKPWDIAAVSDIKVAVTLPEEEKIQFISINQGCSIVKESEIFVSGSCRGMAYRKESQQLIVSFDKPESKVQIMDISGNVSQNIMTDCKGNNLFIKPWYLALSPDQFTIYVSDNGKDMITSLTLDGKVKAIFSSCGLKEPVGLTVDNTGAIFVASSSMYSGSIMKLSDRLTSVQAISIAGGVVQPRNIIFFNQGRKLYVGQKFSDNILVISLKCWHKLPLNFNPFLLYDMAVVYPWAYRTSHQDLHCLLFDSLGYF